MAYSSDFYGGGINTSPTQNRYKQIATFFSQLRNSGWVAPTVEPVAEPTPAPSEEATIQPIGEFPKPTTPQTSYGGVTRVSDIIDDEEALAKLGITYSPFR